MSFPEYKDWQPGDDDRPELEEIVRLQQAEIESLRDSIRNLASVVLQLNEQNAMIRQWLEALGESLTTLRTAFLALYEWVDSHQTWLAAIRDLLASTK